MLKDLRLPGRLPGSKGIQGIQKRNIDTEISCNLVDILFRHVLTSIQMDRSSVKINAFNRGIIGGVLGRTRDGTKEYVMGMKDSDIKLLLDDVEKELVRRRKR